MTPLPSIYYPDFIAANQEKRANNLIDGSRACMAHVEHIRRDIRYGLMHQNTGIGRLIPM